MFCMDIDETTARQATITSARSPGVMTSDPSQARVRPGVLCAHQEVGRRFNGFLERQSLSIKSQIAQALVRRADPIVRFGGRTDPALGDPAPFADVVFVLL